MKRWLWSLTVFLGLLVTTAATRPLPASKKPAAHPKGAQSSQVFYVCKMDQYTSTKPGKCPRCGMALIKVTAKPVPNASSTKPKM